MNTRSSLTYAELDVCLLWGKCCGQDPPTLLPSRGPVVAPVEVSPALLVWGDPFGPPPPQQGLVPPGSVPPEVWRECYCWTHLTVER